MWDTRYSSEDYAYGTEPNVFFKEALEKYGLSGTILFPAEGEGRNAVYAAKMGLDVTAFDTSIEGRKKALKLADKEHVKILYEVGDLFALDLVDRKYDCAALIFAHFPASILLAYHTKIAELIKDDGLILLEGFSKNHLKFRNENAKVGGPSNSEMLFSLKSIQKDFANFEVILLEEREVKLAEGKFHDGVGSVIRFVGRKVRS